MNRLKLGLIINPLAGIGGPAALKGSDGAETVAAARASGAVSQVVRRVTKALSPLLEVADERAKRRTTTSEQETKQCNVM